MPGAIVPRFRGGSRWPRTIRSRMQASRRPNQPYRLRAKVIDRVADPWDELEDPCPPATFDRRINPATRHSETTYGSLHRLDLDARVSRVLGRGSRAQQTGSIFHGIRAVHATGRSAHR